MRYSHFLGLYLAPWSLLSYKCSALALGPLGAITSPSVVRKVSMPIPLSRVGRIQTSLVVLSYISYEKFGQPYQ